MATYTTEQVTEVTHWNDKLFSFVTTRRSGLRFENGQFVMLGLNIAERKVVRAYSIASANYEERLEFYSIKVPQGLLTSRLAHIEPGAELLISSKPTGTLVLRDLKPGRRLFMLATGTGAAPFLSVAKDPETYERFEQVVLVRGARTAADLAYGDAAIRRLRDDPHLGELVRERLLDYPTVTREPFRHRGRVTRVIETEQLFRDLKIPALDPADRFMICGNMRMLKDADNLLQSRDFTMSPQIGVPGDCVIERAFVESFDTAAAAERHELQAGESAVRGAAVAT
jgi:ferredoxin--NADP+ reductase